MDKKEVIEMNDGILQWKTYTGSGWNTVNSNTPPLLKMSFDEDRFKITKNPPGGSDNLEDIMTIDSDGKIIFDKELIVNGDTEFNGSVNIRSDLLVDGNLHSGDLVIKNIDSQSKKSIINFFSGAADVATGSFNSAKIISGHDSTGISWWEKFYISFQTHHSNTLGGDLQDTLVIKGKNVNINGTISFDDSNILIKGFKNENNMASNSNEHLPTQRSVKAYVDDQISSVNSASSSLSETDSISILGISSSEYIKTNLIYSENNELAIIGDLNIENNLSVDGITNLDGVVNIQSEGQILNIKGLNYSRIAFHNGGNRTSWIGNESSSTPENFWIRNEHSGDIIIDSKGAEDGRLYITQNGRMGIGEDLPDEKLHVNGSVKINNNLIFKGTSHITTFSLTNPTSNKTITIPDRDGTLINSISSSFTHSNGEISLKTATTTILGGIKTNYTTSGKNYKVDLDASDNAFVNVEWTKLTNAEVKNIIKADAANGEFLSYNGTALDWSTVTDITGTAALAKKLKITGLSNSEISDSALAISNIVTNYVNQNNSIDLKPSEELNRNILWKGTAAYSKIWSIDQWKYDFNSYNLNRDYPITGTWIPFTMKITDGDTTVSTPDTAYSSNIVRNDSLLFRKDKDKKIWTFTINQQSITASKDDLVKQLIPNNKKRTIFTITETYVDIEAGLYIKQGSNEGIIEISITGNTTKIYILSANNITFTTSDDLKISNSSSQYVSSSLNITISGTDISAAQGSLNNQGTLNAALSGDTNEFIVTADFYVNFDDGLEDDKDFTIKDSTDATTIATITHSNVTGLVNDSRNHQKNIEQWVYSGLTYNPSKNILKTKGHIEIDSDHMTYLKLKNLAKSITFKVNNSLTSDSIINIPPDNGTLCIGVEENLGLSLSDSGKLSINVNELPKFDILNTDLIYSDSNNLNIIGAKSIESEKFIGNLEGEATSVANGVYTTNITNFGSGKIITDDERTKLNETIVSSGDQAINGNLDINGILDVGGILSTEHILSNSNLSIYPNGPMNIYSNGGMLNLYSDDHSYIGFWEKETRMSYVGFPWSGTNDFHIQNQTSDGSIHFATNNIVKLTLDKDGDLIFKGTTYKTTFSLTDPVSEDKIITIPDRSGTLINSSATTSVLGGIKTGYTTNTTDKKYKVELDGSYNAYVNVNWQNTNTQLTNTEVRNIIIDDAADGQFLSYTGSGLNWSTVTNISGNAGTVTNGVYTTGNQSIGGQKTFTSKVSIHQDNTPFLLQLKNEGTTTTGAYIRFTPDNSGKKADIGFGDSDGRAYFRSYDNASLLLGTKDRYLNINSNGNVTINDNGDNNSDKAASQYKLYVEGDEYVRGNLDVEGVLSTSHIITEESLEITSNSLLFNCNENIIINGKVGIGGIESPEAALDIRSNTDTTGGAKNIFIDCNNQSDDTDENGLVWKPKYSGYSKKSAGILFNPEADAFRGGLVFYTNDTATTSGSYEQRMHLDMNGNLELKSGTLSIINSANTDPLISLKRKDDTYKLNIKISSITSLDKNITFPNKTGTICVAAGSGLSLNSNGEMSISTIDTVDIDGGAIDGTVIGGATPAAGSFTSGSFTGITLKSTSTNISADNTIAAINFQSPNESDGSDSILVSAGIAAIAEANFTTTDNKTRLSFKTGSSETATEKMSLNSTGFLGINTRNPNTFLTVRNLIENSDSWKNNLPVKNNNKTIPETATAFLGAGRNNQHDNMTYWGTIFGTLYNGHGYIQQTQITNSSNYDLFLNPDGGGVELGNTSSSIIAKGNLTVNGTTTLEGVLSTSHIINEESIDIISNSLLINCNEHVMIDGDLQILGNNSKSKFNPRILFSENNISDEDFYIQYVGNEGSGAAGNRLRIGSGNSGWSSEAITILGNGKVGIGGIESPEVALDIRSNTDTNSGAKNIYIDCNNQSDDTDENGLIWKPKYSGYTKKSAGILFKPEADFFRGGLVFYTNGADSVSGNYEQRMIITSSGRVGINTDPGSSMLKVNGAFTATGGANILGTTILTPSGSSSKIFELKKNGASEKVLNINIASNTTTDKTITFPNKTGTICVAAGSNSGLSLNTSGEMSISTIDNIVIGGTTPAAGSFTTGSFTSLSIKNTTNSDSVFTLRADRDSNTVEPEAIILFKAPDAGSGTGTYDASKIISGWEDSSSWLSSFIKFQTHHSNPGGNTGDLQDTLKLKGGNVELSTSGKSTTVKGNLTVKEATTLESTLDVTSDLKINTDKFVVTASNGNTDVAGTLDVTGNTTLGGTLTVDGVTTFKNGSGSDIFKIEGGASTTNLNLTQLSGSSGSMIIGKGTNVLNIGQNGRTTIATSSGGTYGYDYANSAITAKTYRLYLQDGSDSGSLYAESKVVIASGGVDATAFNNTSDSRIKHNLQGLNNGLETILKLNPQIYFKTTKLYEKENHDFDLDNDGNPITEENYTKEAGFIAQEIKEIDDIEYLVSGGDTIGENGEEIKEKYYLRYNDIFVYNVKATQELYQKNVDLENKVNQLEDKIDELTKIIKEKLN